MNILVIIILATTLLMIFALILFGYKSYNNSSGKCEQSDINDGGKYVSILGSIACVLVIFAICAATTNYGSIEENTFQ